MHKIKFFFNNNYYTLTASNVAIFNGSENRLEIYFNKTNHTLVKTTDNEQKMPNKEPCIFSTERDRTTGIIVGVLSVYI